MTTLAQALTACDSIGTQRFRDYLAFLIPAEVAFQHGHYGDYDFVLTECVPGDTGGRTRYGIDQASHPSINVGALSLADAANLYNREVWAPVDAEHLPYGYGEGLADVRVNGGNGPVFLQQGLNDLGAGLVVDGHLGPKSRAAMLKYGSEGVHAFLNHRDAYFRYLAANHPNDRQFLAGWLDRDEALAGWLEHNNNLRLHLALASPTPSQAIA